MRMELVENEALRLKGWSGFRSASRDRVIPSTGAGAVLQRVKIAGALPVLGVFEGVAISDEERTARDEQRRLGAALAERSAAGTPLGLTQYLASRVSQFIIDEIQANEFSAHCTVGFAPFDGFITEFVYDDTSAVPTRAIALRSSGGATMFSMRQNDVPAAGFLSREPDYVDDVVFATAGQAKTLTRCRMPVFAGEELTLSMILPTPVGLNDYAGNIVLGFEAFIMARPGSAAAQSMFGALTVEARRAATEAASQSSRLAIERERTARTVAESAARIEVAKLAVEARRAASQPMLNPFNLAMMLDSAQQQFARRARVPAPPPRFSPPPPEPPVGTGKTFVSAWNPSFGSIGYLIPDPPRGGRVNVFDNTYTIWDITGKNIGTGPIIPIRSDAEIPPGARLSPSIAASRRVESNISRFRPASEQ